MNLLLFEKNELTGKELYLADRRARHIIEVLRLEVGDTLRVGMVNGDRGTGRVNSIEGHGVHLSVRLDQAPAPAPSVELILALPRPIMLQRILKQATVLGVRGFHLIRSRRVEKSFFHSPVLQPEKIKSLLIEGLEQAMDTRLPEVHIYHRFKPFIEDVAPTLSGLPLCAHPEVKMHLPGVFARNRPGENILLAVGPEGGWTDYELQQFMDHGFHCFSMGSRILHVDTAVVALLAQLQLLQDLSAL